MTRIFAAEFDNCNHEKPKGIVQYFETQEEGELISVTADGRTYNIIESFRDRWGVFHNIGVIESGITIFQEDGTRSFLDGLIQALTKLKERTEYNTQKATQI